MMMMMMMASGGLHHRHTHGQPEGGARGRHSRHISGRECSGNVLSVRQATSIDFRFSLDTITVNEHVLTFQIAVYRFVGPTASKLTASHGGHVVCMAGAVIATLGLLAASFVNNIPLLILCYAVITGLGFGLMYIPAIVACVPYFTKNRFFKKT